MESQLSDWQTILAVLGAMALIWFLVRGAKHNPEAFSKENLNKSSFTMGLLALGLIGLIAFCVVLLNMS